MSEQQHDEGPKAVEPFFSYDSETGQNTLYEPGDDVPADVAQRVGDHLLDRPVERQAAPAGDSESGQGAGVDPAELEARIQAAVDEAVDQALQARTAAEEAALEAATGGDEPFDPTADGVKAAEVKTYLEGLDRDTVVGRWEFQRVVDAEKAGANRSTAYPAE